MAGKGHILKTWPEFFQQVRDGKKPWEFRKNDRNFEAGDVLILDEWDPKTGASTGRVIVGEVPYVLHGPAFGLPEGYCILSLPKTTNLDKAVN